MSKRPGKGGTTAPPSEAAASASNSDDGDGEKQQKLAATALASIKTCYRNCFVASIASAVVTVVDGDMIARYRSGPDDDEHASLSWVDGVDLFDSLAFFTFSFGLFRIASIYQRSAGRNNQKGQSQKVMDEDFAVMLRAMSVSWGIVAMNFAAAIVAMAAAMPEHSRGGPLDSLLGGVSSTTAASTAVGVLVVCGVGISAYCSHTSIKADAEDNRRISLLQQKSKQNVTFATSRRRGYKAYRNQALCVGTFTILSVMELLKWIVNGDGGILGRLLSVSDVLAPFTLSWLMYVLNRSFLKAAIVRLRVVGGDKANDCDDEAVYGDLFAAQTGFYENVAEAMKDATIFRLLPYFVRPFCPQLLSILEGISPWLAEKVVQLLDIVM